MATKTPAEVAESALTVGLNKLRLSQGNYGRFIILTILAGIYIAFGGTLSLIVGYGFPEAAAANPALQKVMSGAMFPIGLILVVVLGAELFTGNNALLMPAWMLRRCSLKDVIVNWTLVYLGNFAGAMLFVYFMVYLTGLTAPQRHNKDSPSESVDAVDYRIYQRHRSQLVRVPCHMARAVGQKQRR